MSLSYVFYGPALSNKLSTQSTSLMIAGNYRKNEDLFKSMKGERQIFVLKEI